MTQSQIDRVLPFYKDAGFYAMEVWGGAVPDSVMRYLGENPWDRLEKIKAAVGDVSLLTALSRGRNLFGYAPYTDEIIDGFCRNSMESGLGIMRIFDALNDVDNVKSTIKYVKKYNGIADCAICYTIDPKDESAPAAPAKKGFLGLFGSKKEAAPQKELIFTDAYFLDKARQMVELGADMITIKDMSGLIPPKRVYDLVKLLKTELGIPVDFHTHCTPGYGLASVVSAIAAGVDVVDTNIWNFSGGPAAPSIEFIYLFCKEMGVELDINMEAVAKINHELFYIRKELADVDAVKMFPKPFNPLTEQVPAEIDAQIKRAAKAAIACDEDTLMDACRKIEDFYGFPPPNELVKTAEIPGGMYTNMVAQLKALKSEEILEAAMKLIPQVRKDAGLIPLVTPTSQIVGAQAVNCALDLKNGKPMYTTCSNQFVSLVKGEYGKTPVPIDPAFRKQITGSEVETPYDTSKYKMQENPVIEGCGRKLAENEKEVLLLELFPQVAKDYLTRFKNAQAEAEKATQTETAPVEEVKKEEFLPVTGSVISSPMPGRVFRLCVAVGDEVADGQDVIILEAMKMENNIATPFKGKVRQIFVNEGDSVATDGRLLEIE